jgi:hypothetical protein
MVLRENDEGQLVMAHNFEDLGIGVFFGNDGFLQNAKVRAEVSALRRLLAFKDIQVLGFGISDSGKPKGKSWALVVRNDDIQLLGTILNAAHGVVFYRGVPPLEAVVRDWLDELAIDPDAITLNDVAETTGPTDGNVRISFHVEHQLVAKNERKAEARYLALLGQATCRRIEITDEEDGTFQIEADVYLDLGMLLDPPVSRQSSVEALQAVYEMANEEYAKRFDFHEMDELNVEVLSGTGDVLDIEKLIREKGGAL